MMGIYRDGGQCRRLQRHQFEQVAACGSQESVNVRFDHGGVLWAGFRAIHGLNSRRVATDGLWPLRGIAVTAAPGCLTFCNRRLLMRLPAQREAGPAQGRGIGNGVAAMQFKYPPGDGQAQSVTTSGPVA